jgi:hypothetical protein
LDIEPVQRAAQKSFDQFSSDINVRSAHAAGFAEGSFKLTGWRSVVMSHIIGTCAPTDIFNRDKRICASADLKILQHKEHWHIPKN